MSDLSSPAETGEDQTPTPLQALAVALEAARDTSHYRWPQQEDLPPILTAVREAIAAEIDAAYDFSRVIRTQPGPLPDDYVLRVARDVGLKEAAAIARRTV